MGTLNICVNLPRRSGAANQLHNRAVLVVLLRTLARRCVRAFPNRMCDEKKIATHTQTKMRCGIDMRQGARAACDAVRGDARHIHLRSEKHNTLLSKQEPLGASLSG